MKKLKSVVKKVLYNTCDFDYEIHNQDILSITKENFYKITESAFINNDNDKLKCIFQHFRLSKFIYSGFKSDNNLCSYLEKFGNKDNLKDFYNYLDKEYSIKIY